MLQASLSLETKKDKIELRLNCAELAITWEGTCLKSKEEIIKNIHLGASSNEAIEKVVLHGQYAEEIGDIENQKEYYKRFKEWGEVQAYDIFPQHIRNDFGEIEKKGLEFKRKIYLSITFHQDELALIPLESMYWDGKFLSERFIISRSLNIGENEKIFFPQRLTIDNTPCLSAIIVNPTGDPNIKPYQRDVSQLLDNLDKTKILKKIKEPGKIGNTNRRDIIRYLINTKFLVFFGHSDYEKGWMVKSGDRGHLYFTHEDIDRRQLSTTLVFSYSCHSISLGKTFKKGGVEYFPGTFWPIKGSPKNTEFVQEFFDKLFENILEEKPVCEIFWDVANRKVNDEYYYPFIGRSYGFYGSPVTPLIDISNIRLLIGKIKNDHGNFALKERIAALEKMQSYGNIIPLPPLVEIFERILGNKDEYPEFKKEVVFYLAASADKISVNALVKGFERNPDKEIQKWIIGALGAIEGDESKQALEKITGDKNPDKNPGQMGQRFLSVKPGTIDDNQRKAKIEDLLKARMLNPAIRKEFDSSLKLYLKDGLENRRIILEIAGEQYNEVRAEAVEVLRQSLEEDEMQRLYLSDIKGYPAKIEKEFKKLAAVGFTPLFLLLLKLNIEKIDEEVLVFLIEMLGEITPGSSLIREVMQKLAEIRNNQKGWLKNLANDTYYYIDGKIKNQPREIKEVENGNQ